MSRAMVLRVRVTGEQAVATVAVRESHACRVAVRSAYDAARAEVTYAQLAIMPLDRFKDAFPRRFRVAALGWAGEGLRGPRPARPGRGEHPALPA
jgi:hypothetical protein